MWELLTFQYILFYKTGENRFCYQKNEKFYFCERKLFSPCDLKTIEELEFKSETIFPFTTILKEKDKTYFKKKLNITIDFLPDDKNLVVYNRVYKNHDLKKPDWKITNFTPYHSCSNVCKNKGLKCAGELGHCKYLNNNKR